MADKEKEVVTAEQVGQVPAEVLTGQRVAPADVKTPRLKAMFDELQAKKAALAEQLKPFREFHDAHVNDPRFIEARKKIKEINALLGPLDNEIAALARALGARGVQAEMGVYESKMPS